MWWLVVKAPTTTSTSTPTPATQTHPNKHIPTKVAARFDYPHICAMLLKEGAEVNLTDEEGWTPLMMASDRGNLDCFWLMFLNKFG